MFKKEKSYLIGVFLLMACHLFYYSPWDRPQWTDVISFDVSGYYVYLPYYFYDDPAQPEKLKETYLERNQRWPSLEFRITEKGRYLPKYSAGMAVCYIPPFVFAHIYSTFSSHKRNGYSKPYQVSLAIWSMLIACLGLFLLHRALRVYFNWNTTAWTIIIIALATNFLQFTTVKGTMPHGYLFCILAGLILLFDSWYKKPNWTDSICIGGLIGLAALIRPTEVIFILPFLFWKFTGFKTQFRMLWGARKYIIVMGLCIGAIGFIQLLHWNYVSGSWFNWSYGDHEHFNWLNPKIWKGLFSFTKGWFIWTPIMLFILPGFAFLYKKQKSLFTPILIFTLINIYIVFSWWCWWYGGSFSQRSMIQSYALLAFPLAAFIEIILRKAWSKYLFGILTIFFLWLNVFQTFQATNGIIDTEYMRFGYYMKIFGAKKIDKSLRVYNQTDEFMPASFTSKLKEVKMGKEKSLLLPTYISNSQKTSPFFEIDLKDYKNCAWLRVKAEVLSTINQYFRWHQSLMSVKLTMKNGEEREKVFRIQDIIEPNDKSQVLMDLKINKDESNPAMQASLHFWHPGGNQILSIDHVKFWVFCP